jgi:hypothetical protein
MKRARASKIAVALHAIAVLAAFIWTLNALHLNPGVSGLEYWYQIMLAFPWSIIPVGGFGYRVDAMVLLFMGWLNTAILYRYLIRKTGSTHQAL